MAEPIDWDVVAQRIALQSGYDPTLVEGITLDDLEDRLGQTVEEIKTKATEIVENPDITYSGVNLMTDEQIEEMNAGVETPEQICINAGGTWDGTSCQMPDLLEEETSEGDKLSVLNNQKSAFLAALRASGMSADMIDELWTWALAEFQSDSTFTADRALLEMYDQPAFKLRFPAIGQMEGAPTPGEYIQYERAIRQEFKKFGAGYPSANVITSLLIANVSTTEVTERLSEAERVLYSVPAEVRDTFNDWWGEEGAKEITMSLFLDPNQDWSNLQDKINTAEVGAWGKMVAGLDAGWDRDMANAVADLGLSQAQTWNSFASLKDKELLFAENIGEDRNLRYETEGVEAEFGIGGSALTLQDIIERRKQRRISRFAGGGTSQSGAIIAGTTTGMGSANA